MLSSKPQEGTARALVKGVAEVQLAAHPAGVCLKREADDSGEDLRAVGGAHAQLQRLERLTEARAEPRAEVARSQAAPALARPERPVPIAARLRGRHQAAPVSVGPRLSRHVAQGVREHQVAHQPCVAGAAQGSSVLEADAIAASHPPPRPPPHIPAHALQVEEVGHPRAQLCPGHRLPTTRGLPKELL